MLRSVANVQHIPAVQNKRRDLERIQPGPVELPQTSEGVLMEVSLLWALLALAEVKHEQLSKLAKPLQADTFHFRKPSKMPKHNTEIL